MKKDKEQNEKPVKATYYIKNPSLIKKLKYLSVTIERDQSDLVTEAIDDLLKKYSKHIPQK